MLVIPLVCLLEPAAEARGGSQRRSIDMPLGALGDVISVCQRLG